MAVARITMLSPVLGEVPRSQFAGFPKSVSPKPPQVNVVFPKAQLIFPPEFMEFLATISVPPEAFESFASTKPTDWLEERVKNHGVSPTLLLSVRRLTASPARVRALVMVVVVPAVNVMRLPAIVLVRAAVVRSAKMFTPPTLALVTSRILKAEPPAVMF